MVSKTAALVELALPQMCVIFNRVGLLTHMNYCLVFLLNECDHAPHIISVVSWWGLDRTCALRYDYRIDYFKYVSSRENCSS